MIQKLVKRRKKQDHRVPKKKISATDSVQIDLDLINVDQIVVSDKFKHSDGFKYFICYKEGKIVKL